MASTTYRPGIVLHDSLQRGDDTTTNRVHSSDTDVCAGDRSANCHVNYCPAAN